MEMTSFQVEYMSQCLKITKKVSSMVKSQSLVPCFLKMRTFRFFNQYKGKNEGFDGAVPRDIVGKS